MIAAATTIPTMWYPAFTAPQTIGFGFVDSNVAGRRHRRK
jgi:hypothetical protein